MKSNKQTYFHSIRHSALFFNTLQIPVHWRLRIKYFFKYSVERQLTSDELLN